MTDRQTEWATRLGLAARPLFGADSVHVPGSHVALTDGIAGSFVLSSFESKEDAAAIQPADRADWSWSSLMPHHVAVERDEVVVTSDTLRFVESFTLASVDSRLDAFLHYLERSIPQHAMDAIDHAVLCFQRLRATLRTTPEAHIATFLALVAMRLEHPKIEMDELPSLASEIETIAVKYDIASSMIDHDALSTDFAARFFHDLLAPTPNGRTLRLDLLIRHAAGELFQAAHLAPPPPSRQLSLIGMQDVELPIRPRSLKGIAYTPLGLARAIAEQAFRVSRTPSGHVPTILDPACGSGAFLVETLTTLGRLGYRGPVRLVGYDVSPAAASTAAFSVACTALDYPEIVVEREIRVQDFLDPAFSPAKADIVVMNPPFLSWGDMPPEERHRTRSTLGQSFSGRPDRSMLFIDRAVECVRPEGVIATLVPAGVLASDSAKRWREGLAKRATPQLVASFGEHSLFRFATVQIAAMILQKAVSSHSTTVIWASAMPGSAAAALRNLRRRATSQDVAASPDEPSWSIYSLDTEYFTNRPLWLPAPGLMGQLPAIAERLQTRVGDVFHVRLGIRAGHRAAFIISEAKLNALPEAERLGFRPIAEKHGIHDGVISATDYLFVAGDEIDTEEELRERFSTYYSERLRDLRTALAARAGVGDKWWRLARSRHRWMAQKGPRIVSRRWVRSNGFAVDRDGSFVVVQGCAWFPRPGLTGKRDVSQSADEIADLLYLYCIMFSSETFYRILREFSIQVAGGQVAVDQKYVKHVPIPLLTKTMILIPELGRMASDFLNQKDFPPLEIRNRFAAQAYGLEY